MPTTPLRTRLLIGTLFTLLCVGILLQIIYYFPRTVDDTFISLRYAERWVQGAGLSYNDAAPVEGFSNPLWVALQSILIAFGLEGLTATKLLSLASLTTLFTALFAVAKGTLKLSTPIALLALLLTASNSYILSWGLLGLETPLFLTALLAFLATSHRLIERTPTHTDRILYVLSAIALGLSRPEAPLYLLTIGLSALLAPQGQGSKKERFRVLFWPSLCAIGSFLSLIILRYSYYGEWLPHTYTSKQGSGFALSKLAPLYAQGSHPIEVVALSLAALCTLGIARKHTPALSAVFGSCAFFIASVEVDWMPNQRHALPLWIVVSLTLPWLLQRIISPSKEDSQQPTPIPQKLLATLLLLSLCALSFVHASIDSRYSIFDFKSHGKSKIWVRPKTQQAWADALHSVQNKTPEHVQHMSVHHSGMIQQLYRILENAPDGQEHTSWYIGRDIGRVGYYSPVQIFDTPGLFTPAAIQPKHGSQHRVSTESIRAAFALNPIQTELLGPWSSAAHRERHLWSKRFLKISPSNFRIRSATQPTPQEIVARYQRVGRKLPSWFKMATLYGESVQGAMEKRVRYVQNELQDTSSFTVKEVPSGLSLQATFDNVIRLHGCALGAKSTDPLTPVEITCYWEALRPVRRDYTVFIHLVDSKGRHTFSADHPLVGGWWPSTKWVPGEIVRDRSVIHVKKGTRLGTFDLAMGLFDGNHRARTGQGSRTDKDGRLRGLSLEIIHKAP